MVVVVLLQFCFGPELQLSALVACGTFQCRIITFFSSVLWIETQQAEFQQVKCFHWVLPSHHPRARKAAPVPLQSWSCWRHRNHAETNAAILLGKNLMVSYSIPCHFHGRLCRIQGELCKTIYRALSDDWVPQWKLCRAQIPALSRATQRDYPYIKHWSATLT